MADNIAKGYLMSDYMDQLGIFGLENYKVKDISFLIGLYNLNLLSLS